MQRLGLVVKQLTELLPQLGVQSDAGQAVLKALNSLAKYVPGGSVSPASEKNQIEQMAMKNAQNNQQMQMLKQQQGAQGQAAPPQQMPQGAA